MVNYCQNYTAFYGKKEDVTKCVTGFVKIAAHKSARFFIPFARSNAIINKT